MIPSCRHRSLHLACSIYMTCTWPLEGGQCSLMWWLTVQGDPILSSTGKWWSPTAWRLRGLKEGTGWKLIKSYFLPKTTRLLKWLKILQCFTNSRPRSQNGQLRWMRVNTCIESPKVEPGPPYQVHTCGVKCCIESAFKSAIWCSHTWKYVLEKWRDRGLKYSISEPVVISLFSKQAWVQIRACSSVKAPCRKCTHRPERAKGPKTKPMAIPLA